MNTSTLLSIKYCAPFFLFSFIICVSTYNSVGVGLRSSYETYKINIFLKTISQINTKLIFEEKNYNRKQGHTRNFSWFTKESDPPVCLLMEP